MSRRLRFNGTGSGDTGCPSVHEDLDTKEVIVHGKPLTDPEDIAQLQYLSEGEVAVVVPREILVDFAPKDRAPQIIGLDAFNRLFENFKHTAWRLESRRRYASDEATETYEQFLRNGAAAWDLGTPYCVMVRRQVALGKRFGRVRIIDDPPTIGQLYLLDNAERNSALGENILSLGRAEAESQRLPEEDFWIFDSRLVALLNFDGDDNLVDVELITEPAVVNRYAQARDAACHQAIPYDRLSAEGTSAAE